MKRRLNLLNLDAEGRAFARGAGRLHDPVVPVGDQERCLQAGMDGYVSKPIDVARLLAEIRRVRTTLNTQA